MKTLSSFEEQRERASFQNISYNRKSNDYEIKLVFYDLSWFCNENKIIHRSEKEVLNCNYCKKRNYSEKMSYKEIFSNCGVTNESIKVCGEIALKIINREIFG